MRAVQVTSLDGPRAVETVTIDDPTPGADDVLIEVHAAGLTFPDVLHTRGLYQLKPPLPFVPGSEVAGVVRQAPAGGEFAVGDRVLAATLVGGLAELIAVAPDMVFALPDEVSFAHGAALPVNYLTAHFALQRRGRLAAGDTVLVHGAAGGVGTAAIQVARALGATVIAVASTEEKAALARAAGAHHTVPVEGFAAAVKELTDGAGVDVVVDPVGGDRFTDSLRSLATEGRLLVIGFVGGDIPTVKVNRLLLNNTSVVGVAWGEFAFRRPGTARAHWDQLVPLLVSGELVPPIGHRFPLADAGEALALMDERRAVGKVVLDVR